eukprot:12929364-Prorocentrum_lima.AAC.1
MAQSCRAQKSDSDHEELYCITRMWFGSQARHDQETTGNGRNGGVQRQYLGCVPSMLRFE